MDQNGKKIPTAEELDRFWDISALTPRSRQIRSRRPESVEAVEIDVDHGSVDSDAVVSQRLTSTEPSKREVGQGRDESNRPSIVLDEPASPPTPYDDYTPAHRLIHRVRIYDKSGVYNYYEQFLDHARRVAGLRGHECDHVPFFSYVPQFSQLTKQQLNWYLWWRECLWSGSCPDTDFSYILLYIYEKSHIQSPRSLSRRGYVRR